MSLQSDVATPLRFLSGIPVRVVRIADISSRRADAHRLDGRGLGRATERGVCACETVAPGFLEMRVTAHISFHGLGEAALILRELTIKVGVIALVHII